MKKVVLFKFIRGIIKASAHQQLCKMASIKLDVLLISRIMELNLPEE